MALWKHVIRSGHANSFLVSEILMELHRAEDHWRGEELIERFAKMQKSG